MPARAHVVPLGEKPEDAASGENQQTAIQKLLARKAVNPQPNRNSGSKGKDEIRNHAERGDG